MGLDQRGRINVVCCYVLFFFQVKLCGSFSCVFLVFFPRFWLKLCECFFLCGGFFFLRVRTAPPPLQPGAWPTTNQPGADVRPIHRLPELRQQRCRWRGGGQGHQLPPAARGSGSGGGVGDFCNGGGRPQVTSTHMKPPDYILGNAFLGGAHNKKGVEFLR